MKHKLFLLFLIYFTTYGQVANPPDNYFVCDDDFDGVSQFDYISQNIL